MTVEYRELARFPGHRFGSDGSVWSRWVGRTISQGHCKLTRVSEMGDEWKLRKPVVNTASGYRQVRIMTVTDGIAKYKTHRLHRLILEAFDGPCPSGLDGCHNDGNKSNNVKGNLRWDTKKSNTADVRKHGRMPIGEKSYRATLNEDQVREIIRKRAAGEAILSLAYSYSTTKSAISSIIYGNSWKHIPRPARS